MRGLWLVAALLIPAGCLDEGAEPVQVADAAAADGSAADAEAAAQEPVVTSVEGRYRAIKPFGDKLQEEGGVNGVEVSGWRDVTVTLDSSIEVDLVLLAPGCSDTAAACALRFSPAEDTADGIWSVPVMEAGSWTAVVEADEDDYAFVDGVYAIHFAYTV